MPHNRKPKQRRPALRSVSERNALVVQWIPLVWHVAKRMRPIFRKAAPSYIEDDAVQYGMIALIRAADLWDESRHVQFKTYAYRAVRSYMVREMTSRGRLVYLPVYLQYALAGIKQSVPVNAECVRAGQIVYRSKCVPPADIADRIERNPREEHPKLFAAIAKLRQSDREVLCRYYGLNGEIRHNMRELAKQVRVSHQRIAQRIGRIYGELRRHLEATHADV